jgi:RNA polymerase sigma-70 factor, ECF subfamily
VYFPSDDPDAALVARSIAGDQGAFEVLVDRYERVLFGVAFRMLGNREDAADATQTAFVRAFERLATYDCEYKFFSWIYRILANECLNQLRARRPSEPVSPEMVVGGGPLEQLEAAERDRLVQDGLLQLTPEYREVITLRHFADLSYEEIGHTLGIPVKTVKSRLFTARQQLGRHLLGWSQNR